MSLAAGSLPTSRPAQNWIISRNWDIVFIIAAPILAFFWAVGTLQLTSVGVVLSIFMVFNVAHHFPTFIRIYGDRDLLRRFRWELILGPVIPFGLALAAVYYVIISSEQSGQNAEKIAESMLFLFVVLLIWDPWHFLMQHYGFMRIYDRHNQAPRKIAARMDLAVSWIWFICILVLISEWLPDLLYDLHDNHSLPLVFVFGTNAYLWLERFVIMTAAGMGLVYVGYLAWCFKRGYYISKAKLWLLAITFGVMVLTYVPNPLIERIVPGWNFSLGFATLGMVHVTQYLAIVWKYNRGLATKDRARTKGFTRAFAKGGFVILAVYVIACLIYGVAVSFFGVTLPFKTWHKLSGGGGATLFHSSIGVWYGGVLAAIGFTSTFLHYYYDGFIWKFRHKENQQNLVLEETATGDTSTTQQESGHSWWAGQAGSRSPAQVLFRQGLYLGLPIQVTGVSDEHVRFMAEGHMIDLPPTMAGNVFVTPLSSQQEMEGPYETLHDLASRERGRVVRISPTCRGLERRRLMDLGVIPGTVIEMETRSPGGDPTAYRIRGALIALRRESAGHIQIARDVEEIDVKETAK